MNHVDLFSGIGGFSLGLEATGEFSTIAFCDKDPYCQCILTKHWPHVPLYNDIRFMPALAADIVTAGFPCQDVSIAGKGGTIHHPRTGLWYEAFRYIRDIRPRYAVMENVRGLLKRGFSRLLRDLASIGYDAEWHCIPVSAIGAPHPRDRIYIISYPARFRLQGGRPTRIEEPLLPFTRGALRRFSAGHGAAQWKDEPRLHRVVDGVPNWVDRVRVLGNAVVPQMAQFIGYAILESQ